MTLFHNKYRVESARLAGWDYSSPGYYFVTICTHDRKCCLSEIHDGNVVLFTIGKIAKYEWERTGLIRNNVSIHEYVVMPNHVHGIIQINPTGIPPIETPCHGVSTTTTTTEQRLSNWKPGVLGAIVGQFKIQVSKKAHSSGFPDFRWQPRFHDHIIRNDQELFRIRNYICNNPANWKTDKFNA